MLDIRRSKSYRVADSEAYTRRTKQNKKKNVTRDVRKTKNSLHVAERLPHNIVCTLCIHKKNARIHTIL